MSGLELDLRLVYRVYSLSRVQGFRMQGSAFDMCGLENRIVTLAC